MACILAEGEDELRKRLGTLTRVLDGEGYEANTGVHGKRGYSGDYLFMMLGASTPFPLRVWKAMTGYGHRMFFLNLHTSDPDVDQLMSQLNGFGYKWSEGRCQVATESFMQSLWAKYAGKLEWDKESDDMAAKKIIGQLAQFQCKFRGDIIVYEERDEHGKSISHTKPEIEKPHRANQQLYNLARGHALLHRRTHITMEDIPILFPVVFSTAPSPRPDILRLLLRKKGALVASDLIDELKIVRNTAKKEMTKLATLGLGRIEKKVVGDEGGDPWEESEKEQGMWTLHLNDDLKWMISPEINELYAVHGVI